MVDIHDAGLKVRYLWGVMGRNSEMLYTNLLQNITQDLTPVKPCLVEGIPDMWIWNHSVSGVYTTKSAYAWLSNVQGHSDVTDILCAEILALLRGLELCCDHGFRNVVCYSDSKAAVDLGRTAFSSFIRTGSELCLSEQKLQIVTIFKSQSLKILFARLRAR
ncbi:hypothetical protein GmHk_19G055412 [Glycine max]|nr:hypothetical protein GmHk_19G055412 [Glycine max]